VWVLGIERVGFHVVINVQYFKTPMTQKRALDDMKGKL
jgi:hypothetical protein